jgi:NitT/TauT family transport system permease protein
VTADSPSLHDLETAAPLGRRPRTDAGLDDAVVARPARRGVAWSLWSAVWPRLAALGLVLAVWQIVVWTGWRPSYVLPGPAPVLHRLVDDARDGQLPRAVSVTLQRAALGYAIALVVGSLLGLAVARTRVLRTAAGSLISGLQSMPSVAWFPLAILLFQLSERAILFVVVLGAAPSIANGLMAGIDHIPPSLLRAGQVLGARGLSRYRHVILPAALPGFVAGLKQGWAFAWRSLMAGELLVIVGNRPSLGVRLQYAREFSDAEGLLAAMIVVLVIGMAVDILVFDRLDHAIRSRWGLLDPARS